MAWEIETIGVKQGGLFAKWGYRRTMVDENGNVWSEEIPGKQKFNLPKISYYKKNDRRYANGEQITDYCNRDTFTHYRVYAQNENPFAYVTAEPNSEFCGYLTPQPEPAVPPNPFGTPVYGAYRTFDYCDETGLPINVTIESKNYDGPVFPIDLGARSPVVLRKTKTENKFEPFRTSECVLSFMVNENFNLDELTSDDERKFRVTVTKGDKIRFRGYITPDNADEEFNHPPYEVSIRATDAIGGLKSVDYPLPVGSSVDIRQSFVDIIAYCFALTNLNLDIKTITNLYEKNMPTGNNDDPLSLATINPIRLSSDKGTLMKCYDVLAAVAIGWGAYIVQEDGSWNFVRINELSNDTVRTRIYNYKGAFIRSENFRPLRKVGFIP